MKIVFVTLMCLFNILKCNLLFSQTWNFHETKKNNSKIATFKSTNITIDLINTDNQVEVKIKSPELTFLYSSNLKQNEKYFVELYFDNNNSFKATAMKTEITNQMLIYDFRYNGWLHEFAFLEFIKYLKQRKHFEIRISGTQNSYFSWSQSYPVNENNNVANFTIHDQFNYFTNSLSEKNFKIPLNGSSKAINATLNWKTINEILDIHYWNFQKDSTNIHNRLASAFFESHSYYPSKKYLVQFVKKILNSFKIIGLSTINIESIKKTNYRDLFDITFYIDTEKESLFNFPEASKKCNFIVD